MSTTNYRPDIDGLRAIAVALVIIFHMNASWIPGGFIGVDVFFVISGYIITLAIFPQIISGSFSFNMFYVKRIKRILPLFYLVALSSLVFSLWLYTPNDLVSFADSWRYASSFIANIYFEKNSGYFAPTSEVLPLLHTWSLSIEEQFYFIWPAFLILSLRFLPKKVSLFVLMIGFFSLVAYSEYLTSENPEAAYYFIQSRAFELLAGAILAILMFYKKAKKVLLPKALYQVSGVLGLVMLTGLAWLLDESRSFPGFNALWVVLASCLIIFSGESQATFISKILSVKIALLFGRLSYSLYLWHWPVLAFYRYYFNSFGTFDALVCGIITLLLSVLSWQLVENPLRHLNIKKRWVYLFYLILPIMLSVFVAKNIASKEGYPERFSQEVLDVYKVSSLTFDDVKIELPSNEQFPPFEPYVFGNTTKPITTFVWGDSHAGHFRSFVDELGKEKGFASLYGGLGGCPPLLDVDLIKYGKPEQPCSLRNQEIASQIIKYKPEMVFLAARWAMYSETTRAIGEKGSRVYLGDKSDYSESISNSRRALELGLKNTIEFLIANGIKPVLFEQAPSYQFKPSNCIVKKLSYEWMSDISCNLQRDEMEVRQGYANSLIHEIVDRYPEVELVSVVDLLCNSTECTSQLNGVPLYTDNNHLSYEGAKEIARKWLKHAQ